MYASIFVSTFVFIDVRGNCAIMLNDAAMRF